MMRIAKLVDSAKERSVLNMVEEMGNVGGALTFTLSTSREGWLAVCKEFPGIITGGSAPEPTEREIYASVKDAVFAAFDVPARVGKRKNLIKATMREFSFSALCPI